MTVDFRHYTTDQAAAVRETLLEVYAEVYADDIANDPFAGVERFAGGLDNWSARPGWSCVIGYDDDQPVGYAYGAVLPPNARWWGGLLTEVDEDLVRETGARTYALSELMVRIPWRKTGISRQLHDALLAERTEERATLLVRQSHPKVHALYESWGWKTIGDLRPRIEHAPLMHAMLLDLSQS
ncbi:GNAT family N-acetyltransferase [Streptomyces sp. NPDC006476]|uniref:GNAT family N-acetyltransferase n=1 Tax=Streptomyces sp. NPDC006476 TaxID=3157175 RepID=UPI0033ADB952